MHKVIKHEKNSVQEVIWYFSKLIIFSLLHTLNSIFSLLHTLNSKNVSSFNIKSANQPLKWPSHFINEFVWKSHDWGPEATQEALSYYQFFEGQLILPIDSILILLPILAGTSVGRGQSRAVGWDRAQVVNRKWSLEPD